MKDIYTLKVPTPPTVDPSQITRATMYNRDGIMRLSYIGDGLPENGFDIEAPPVVVTALTEALKSHLDASDDYTKETIEDDAEVIEVTP